MRRRSRRAEEKLQHYEERLRRALFKSEGNQLGIKFPNVSRILIETTTVPEASWHGEPRNETFEILPDTKTQFKSNCQWSDCSKGGFDLTKEIEEAIKLERPEGAGVVTCEGTLNNASKSICLLGLKFKYRIEYSS